jgi:hypothetical protein
VNLLELALIGVGVVVLVLLGRFLVAAVNTEGDLSESLGRTGVWAGMILGGLVAASATGIANFGDIIGGFVNFVASHPFVASNLGGISLGALSLSGTVSLSTSQYVGLALLLVGAVFVVTEVDSV